VNLVIADARFGSIATASNIPEDCYFILGAKSNVDTAIKGKLQKKLEKHKWRSVYKENCYCNCMYNDRAVFSFLSNYRDGSRTIDDVPEVVAVYDALIGSS